jgi:hypothetical protein
MPLSPYDLRRVTNFADLLQLMTAGSPPRTQTPGLLVPGNIDLYHRPVVKNPDGSTSTVRSSSFVDERPTSPFFGMEVLIPTVIPDQKGSYYTEMDPQMPASIAYYEKTGQHLGVFTSSGAADAYAAKLHEDYANGLYGPASLPNARDIPLGGSQ